MIELAAGYHDIEVQFFERTGGAQIIVSYNDGTGERVINAAGPSVLRPRGVQDLSPLAGMTDLRILSANNNALDDVRPLTGLTNLQILYLRNNAIRNAGALAGRLLGR